MILQSNGSWVITSQVYNPNAAKQTFWNAATHHIDDAKEETNGMSELWYQLTQGRESANFTCILDYFTG